MNYPYYGMQKPPRKKRRVPFDVPDDVRRIARRGILKKCLGCLTLWAGVGVLFYFYFGEFEARLGLVRAIVVWAVLFLFPPLQTHVIPALFDRSFAGTVEKVDVKGGVVTSPQPFEAQFWRGHYLRVTVRKDNGRRKRVKSFLFVGPVRGRRKCNPPTEREMEKMRLSFDPMGRHLRDFKKGDRVYHFRGLPNELVLDPRRNEKRKCVICGLGNALYETRCCHCGYTLPVIAELSDTYF